MTPTDYATDELAAWEQALQQQREVESKLIAAREKGPRRRVIELLPQVEALRTRADLLLAEAVAVKCFYRSDEFADAWLSSSQSELHDVPHATAEK